MGKCNFKSEWMHKKDGNGHVISSWASLRNGTEVFCKLCTSSIDYRNKGIHAFLQHAGYENHTKLATNMSQQMILITGASGCDSSELNCNSNNGTSLTQVKLHSPRNAATISELIWVMKSVCCNFSAASCHNIKSTFEAMFEVPSDFSLSPKKMNYLITDALAPYFHKLLIEDIGTSYFTICFDETTNVEDKKELQIAVRYWSESKGEVFTRHLQTFFIGKADAHIIYEKINCAISNANLPLKRLLMIGSDGPNVNKKVHMLFNENLIEIRSSGLIDIGTCSIHVAHNAFLKALQAFGEDASDLAFLVYHYFNGWPARCEEFEKIQEELGLPVRKFVKHSPSRWLTLRHATERLIEQWDGLTHYFLKFIPSKKSQILQSGSFKRISNLIRARAIKAEIYFTMSSAELFMTFTETFQKDEPLIHMLYLQLRELAEKLARRVCKDVPEIDSDDLFNTQNLLPLKDVTVSEHVKKELAHLSENDALQFFRNAQKHYIVGCNYLIEKSINNSSLIKAIKCLSPLHIKNKRSCRDILAIARKLPIEIKEDVLTDEFKIAQIEAESSSDHEERIDYFWHKILKNKNAAGQNKYIELAKVVKAILALSHGNANIERRFSTSRHALTDEKASTSERTFNAILTVKDALKMFSNKPELVPMTSKLVSMGQNAHKHYTMYIEEQKRLKEMEAKKKEELLRIEAEAKEKLEKMKESRKAINQMEDKICESKKQHEIASEASNRLFNEANDRLKKALEKGDLREVGVAQGMLEGIISMRKTEQAKLKEVEKLQKNVEKRKNNLISSYFKKPKIA